MTDAIYEVNGDFVHATAYARGPWDPEAQHGGAPAAILMRALEQIDDGGGDLQLARVTYELIRPVPLGDLLISTAVIRTGRRIQLLETALATTDGIEVVKARALRVARAAVTAGSVADIPAWAPEGLREETAFADGRQMYVGSGIEVRIARGAFHEPGPAFGWFRLKVPLIAGETPSPLQRLVAAADFPNGISAELSWDQYLFINPDLAVYVEREPRGEWIGVDATTRITQGGIGLAEAVLYDAEGRVGRSLQTLYVAPR